MNKSMRSTFAYGGSVLLSAAAVGEIVFMFLPKLAQLEPLTEALEVYLERVVPAIGTGSAAGIAASAGLIWIAAYCALEIFSLNTDGVSLWRNIYLDSCGLSPDGLKRKFCTARKWLVTVIGAPVLILGAAVKSLSADTKAITVGYITIDPNVLYGYLKHVMKLVPFLIAALAFVGLLHSA